MAKSKKALKVSEDRKWKIENAADTLLKAEEVKKDKKLFSDARKELRERQKFLKKVLKKK